MKHTHVRGYTLIELSIVLLIVGLIAGGILAGVHLVRQSEVQGVVKEMIAIEAGIVNFKEKYQYLPGDMPNATQYWGAATSCGNAPLDSQATCNGDGSNNANMNGHGVSHETFLVWHHLRNFGLNFDMTDAGYWNYEIINGTPAFIAGFNIPKMAFSNASIGVVMTYAQCAPPYNFPWNCSHPIGMPNSWVLSFGEWKGWGGSIWNQQRTSLQWFDAVVAIDRKMDDGLPLAGNIYTRSNMNWSGANPDYGDSASVYRTRDTVDPNGYTHMYYRMLAVK